MAAFESMRWAFIAVALALCACGGAGADRATESQREQASSGGADAAPLPGDGRLAVPGRDGGPQAADDGASGGDATGAGQGAEEPVGSGAGSAPSDAGRDPAGQPGQDAGQSAGRDAGQSAPRDAGQSAEQDAGQYADAGRDAGPQGSGTRCGGFAGFACPAGEYCDYAAGDGCAISDGFGVCTRQPTACQRIYRPVCGCDGQPYNNACEAARRGVSVAHQGACGERRACGGGATCAQDQSCMGGSRTCGTAGGTCADEPGICNTQYAPVCGCDGHTYGNACQAMTAGAGVASEGACAP